jgi:hypothetical protein
MIQELSQEDRVSLEKILPTMAEMDKLCLQSVIEVLQTQPQATGFKIAINDMGDEICVADAFSDIPSINLKLSELNCSWIESAESYIYSVQKPRKHR